MKLPNGLVGHLFGPQEGRRNDNFMLAESQILEQCALYATRPGTDEHTPNEERFLQLFGDPAYKVNNHLLSPFAGEGQRTEEEREWNVAMSAVRIEVEHGFGAVAKHWPFLNADWKMQVNSSPLGTYYRTAVLLENASSCLRPNQTAKFFQCNPPTLFEYFHN